MVPVASSASQCHGTAFSHSFLPRYVAVCSMCIARGQSSICAKDLRRTPESTSHVCQWLYSVNDISPSSPIPQLIMGRLNHAASRVHTHATQILQNTRHTYPPPWLAAIQTTPPSEKLVRPVLKRTQKPGKRSSRIFQPVNITYEEDKLRWEYFNDHPWELARPRVVLESDGRDREKWDWSVELDVALNRPRMRSKDPFGRTGLAWEMVMEKQAARPLNGEA